jgi:hypothetical protein
LVYYFSYSSFARNGFSYFKALLKAEKRREKSSFLSRRNREKILKYGILYY